MCAVREVSPDHNGDKPATAGARSFRHFDAACNTRHRNVVLHLVAARHDNIDELRDCFENAHMESVRFD